jgi:hypothetical protein
MDRNTHQTVNSVMLVIGKHQIQNMADDNFCLMLCLCLDYDVTGVVPNDGMIIRVIYNSWMI